MTFKMPLFYQLVFWFGMSFLLIVGGFCVVVGLIEGGTSGDNRGLGGIGVLLFGSIFLYWFVKGLSLLRFLRDTIEVNSTALVMHSRRGQTRTYKWSEIEHEKEMSFFQMYELFDKKGHRIVAIDYGIPCFAEFPQIVRSRLGQKDLYAKPLAQAESPPALLGSTLRAARDGSGSATTLGIAFLPPAATTVLSVVFIIVSQVAMLWFGGKLAFDTGNVLLNGYNSVTWQTTTGKIEISEVHEFFHRGTKYSPTIKYTYRVNGQNFQSERVDFRSMGYTKEESTALVERFSQGALVPVYYSLTNPKESTLLAGAYWPDSFLISVGLFLVAGPVFICFRLWRLKKRKNMVTQGAS